MTQTSLAIPFIADYRKQAAAWKVHQGGRSAMGPAAGPIASVVTVAFNAKASLARTIDSIAAQDYPFLEYIVVDGGSTDGTLDIIRNKLPAISLWLSEKDAGISDAFNRGIALATGKYVAIVNADDWLAPSHISFAVDTLEKTGADFVFGDQYMHDAHGQSHAFAGDPHYARLIRRRMPALNHPTVVTRRDAYERFGLFSTQFRRAMDYELLLRFHLRGARGVYDPRLIGNMSLGGTSDDNYRMSLVETRRISTAHGCPTPLAWSEYLYSLVKAKVRRLLQGALPEALLHRLWRVVNPRFRDRLAPKSEPIDRPR